MKDHLALQNKDNMFPQYGGNHSPSDSASYDRTESSIPSPAQYKQSVFQFKNPHIHMNIIIKVPAQYTPQNQIITLMFF